MFDIRIPKPEQPNSEPRTPKFEFALWHKTCKDKIMTQYADQKIREALNLANGSKAKAEIILVALAQKDARLLQDLTAKHMRGIIGYNIERVMNGKAPPAKTPPTSKVVQAKPNSFGMKVLKAAAESQGEVFGCDNGLPPKRQKASQAHIDAINAIVGKTPKG